MHNSFGNGLKKFGKDIDQLLLHFYSSFKNFSHLNTQHNSCDADSSFILSQLCRLLKVFYPVAIICNNINPPLISESRVMQFCCNFLNVSCLSTSFVYFFQSGQVCRVPFTLHPDKLELSSRDSSTP